MSSFSFGGTDLKTYGVYLRAGYERQFLAAQDRPIEFSLGCVVLSSSRADLITKMASVTSLFDPANGYKALVFDDDTGTSYSVKCVEGIVLEYRHAGGGYFTLDLVGDESEVPGATEGGFSYDGIDLKAYGVRLEVGYERPFMAEMENFIRPVAGKDGAYDFGYRFRPLEFKLPCVVTGSSRADVISKITSVTTIFDPANGPRELVFDDSPSLSYSVRCQSGISIRYEKPTEYKASFRLDLICLDWSGWVGFRSVRGMVTVIS